MTMSELSFWWQGSVWCVCGGLPSLVLSMDPRGLQQLQMGTDNRNSQPWEWSWDYAEGRSPKTPLWYPFFEAAQAFTLS